MERGIEEYAQEELAEQVVYACKGYTSDSDIISQIERVENEFDADSYCPYYSQQIDVIDRYEGEFWQNAKDLDDGCEYKAAEWQEAQTAYAYAIAYSAYNYYFEEAKQELVEAIEEFVADVQAELETDSERIEVASKCAYGWAAHDRELEDGTMFWEHGQLDGLNGAARKVGDVWLMATTNPDAGTE